MAKRLNVMLYEQITKKLGILPEDYTPLYDNTENDSIDSPLSRLSLEELEYLIENIFSC